MEHTTTNPDSGTLPDKELPAVEALTSEEIEADQAAMASQAEYEAMEMAAAEAAYWSAQG